MSESQRLLAMRMKRQVQTPTVLHSSALARTTRSNAPKLPFDRSSPCGLWTGCSRCSASRRHGSGQPTHHHAPPTTAHSCEELRVCRLTQAPAPPRNRLTT